MPSGVYRRDPVAQAKTRAYHIRAIESYQPMVDALVLVRPLAIRACDDQAIAAIDKALAAAGRCIESHTPNAETAAALKDSDVGGGETFHGTTEDAFAKILVEDDAGTDGQSPQVRE